MRQTKQIMFILIFFLFFSFATVKVVAMSEGSNEKQAAITNENIFPELDLRVNSSVDKATVAVDPDLGREDFIEEMTNPTKPKTPTTVTVEASDQIKNLEKYKELAKKNKTYASVGSWESLKAAYGDSSKNYIEITGDFSAIANVPIRDLGWRETSIIIDGGGHTVNMDRAAFSVGSNATPRGSVFTITNINLIHWQTGTVSGNTSAADGVIDNGTGRGGYGYWYFNIDNLNLQGPDGETGVANRQPRRLLDAEDSQVLLSGDIKVYAKQELMQIGQVGIVNGASVELQRTLGTTGYSMFYFMAISANNSEDTGFDHKFTVGDGATIKGSELSTYNSNNYPLVYYGFNSMTVGDNVDWYQDGFQMLLDLRRYSGSNERNRSVTFGQNLKMTALRTVGSNSLDATNNSTVTFNAGTELDLQQWNNNTVVRTDAGSTVTFVSPKSLHLSRNNNSGGVATGALFTGAGTFSMNNSQISTWQGSDNQNSTPSGNRNLKFSKLTVIGGKTSVTDAGGSTITSNIIDNSTRELSTIAIDPGTVKLKYVNQYGEVLKVVDYPIEKGKNYIGQYLQIKTELYGITEMPDNYMFAIDEQVPEFAVKDGQSGGDPTSNSDNGDKFGQVNIGIVPMEGTEYTYNIYVYGQPNNNIQYQYKDVKTGSILKSDFLNSGQEKAGSSIVPANYGNSIDWTNSYYTNKNVPVGYHYAVPSELGSNVQPSKTKVGTKAELITLFAYPDKQTVIVKFENKDGSPLVDQESPISIDGYSGQEISYKDLVAGKITEPKATVENGMFTFDYTDNKNSNVDKEPQYLTIKLEFIQVNMHVKQVYKDKIQQPIYTNLESETPVDNAKNIYETTIGDDISDIIINLKTKNNAEIKIDYDWYVPIKPSVDYLVIIDGKEVSTTEVPDKDFDLLIIYTGITNLEVSNLNYGQIPMASKDNEVFDNPDKAQKITVLNTDISNNWELVVSMTDDIENKNNSQPYLGGLLVEKNGTKTVIDSSGVKLSTRTEQDNQLVSKIPMDIKLFQNIGNTLGTYRGEILWTVQDNP